MKLRKITLALLAGTLLAVPGATLRAQGKETAGEKELRKSLQIINESRERWYVGVESMEGTIQLLLVQGNKITKMGSLAAGKMREIPIGGADGLVLSPAPPTKWAGMAKTGKDFSARMYLVDHRSQKLYFNMTRVANAKDTFRKTCCYSFDPGFDPDRFEKILLLPRKEKEFNDSYTMTLSIVGERLPPPGPRTKPAGGGQ